MKKCARLLESFRNTLEVAKAFHVQRNPTRWPLANLAGCHGKLHGFTLVKCLSGFHASFLEILEPLELMICFSRGNRSWAILQLYLLQVQQNSDKINDFSGRWSYAKYSSTLELDFLFPVTSRRENSQRLAAWVCVETKIFLFVLFSLKCISKAIILQ